MQNSMWQWNSTSRLCENKLTQQNIKIVYTAIRYPKSNKTEPVISGIVGYFRVLIKKKNIPNG